MRYILVTFSQPLPGGATTAYQEINGTGDLQRFCDVATGATIVMPGKVEYAVTNSAPSRPAWAPAQPKTWWRP